MTVFVFVFVFADQKDERKAKRRSRRRRRVRGEGGGTGLRSRARVTVGCRPLRGKHLKHLLLFLPQTNKLTSMQKTMWPQQERDFLVLKKCGKNVALGHFVSSPWWWCQPWLAVWMNWHLGKGVGANLELILGTYLLLTPPSCEHSMNILTSYWTATLLSDWTFPVSIFCIGEFHNIDLWI